MDSRPVEPSLDITLYDAVKASVVIAQWSNAESARETAPVRDANRYEAHRVRCRLPRDAVFAILLRADGVALSEGSQP